VGIVLALARRTGHYALMLGSLRGSSRVTAVPTADSPLDELLMWASSTYCGYVRHGGIEPLVRFADDALLVWNHAQRLPPSLDGLRAALFFESRKWHHFPERLDADSERYFRALVAGIGEMSGGAVRDDRKSFVMNTKAALQRYRSHS
jgi:hypothetical protein